MDSETQITDIALLLKEDNEKLRSQNKELEGEVRKLKDQLRDLTIQNKQLENIRQKETQTGKSSSSIALRNLRDQLIKDSQ